MSVKPAYVYVCDSNDIRSVAPCCLFILIDSDDVLAQFIVREGTGLVRTVATESPVVFRELMAKFADRGTQVTFFRESGNHSYRYGV